MISYRDFIKMADEKGYILRDNGPIEIHELSPGVRTFSVKKGSVDKFLEIECLYNDIISVCGKNHPGGCDKSYSCNIKCTDEENKEPFQYSHQCIVLSPNHRAIIDIVVTKVLQKEIDDNDKKTQEWLKLVYPILNIIKPKYSNEYVTWTGNYVTLHDDFLNDSLNLQSGEKMIFYAVNPDIDITKVTLNMKVDILEKLTQKS